MGGETEKELHYEDRKSLLSDSKKDEEKSHDHEEVSIENIKDHFKTRPTLEMKQREYHYETHYTMYMDQRASTDGCLNCEGVPTDGCSQIYVGDIEIIFESVAARQSSHEHEDEYLVQIMKNRDQFPRHHLSFKKLIKSSRKRKRRLGLMNHPSFKGL